MASIDAANSQSYIYNSNGAIDLGSVRNNTEMGDVLEAMKSELLHAKEAGVLSTEVEARIRLSLIQAAREVRMPVPSKPTLIDHICDARDCLLGAGIMAELVRDLNIAVETITSLP